MRRILRFEGVKAQKLLTKKKKNSNTIGFLCKVYSLSSVSITKQDSNKGLNGLQNGQQGALVGWQTHVIRLLSD